MTLYKGLFEILPVLVFSPPGLFPRQRWIRTQGCTMSCSSWTPIGV